MTGLVILSGSEALTGGAGLVLSDDPPTPDNQGSRTTTADGGVDDTLLPPPPPGVADGATATGRPPDAIGEAAQAQPVSFQAGIPSTVLAAYKRAASTLTRMDPGCHLDWPLLAGIGRVESEHAHGGDVDAAGTTRSPILGPVLDGTRFALIRDTDGGRLDGERKFDRAVGPMQFIPSTWAGYAADGNRDGRRDPDNVYDATLAAGGYLCRDDRDVSDPGDRRDAVYSYNHSQRYVNTVLAWADAYARGASSVPDAGPSDSRVAAAPKPQAPAGGSAAKRAPKSAPRAPARPASAPAPPSTRIPTRPPATTAPPRPTRPPAPPTTTPTPPTSTPTPPGTSSPTPPTTTPTPPTTSPNPTDAVCPPASASPSAPSPGQTPSPAPTGCPTPSAGQTASPTGSPSASGTASRARG